MRHLLTLLLLIATSTLVARATPACITNLTVTTQNGWVFDVAGDPSDCYSIVDTYTNLSCIGLLAGSCDYGTALVFRNTNCLASAATVATVTATCNQGVVCANGQGGAYHCQPGDSFTISMPAGVSMFAIRIYPGFSVCCSITYCEITDRTACIPPAPHGDP